jgi:glucuronate isomerase
MVNLFDDDFLLETDAARELYHCFAENEPIIDYHCHLGADLIAKNHRFKTLTELWLDGDHYKWRAMRTNGVSEEYCTGAASDWEKFEAWARTVPHTLRNPLYHWTHLELRRPFGIEKLLSASTAREIYEEANRSLGQDGFTTQGLLRGFNVLVVCTTDDPSDTLEHHVAHARSAAARVTRVYPTFRPDRALAVDSPAALNDWLDRLGAAARMSINGYDDMLLALERRHTFFHEVGCRLSDHGLETVYAADYGLQGVRAVFDKLRAGQAVTAEEADQYRSALLHELALLDHSRGWVQQFHLGALRNNNSRMRALLGPDTGFDSIGEFEIARPLAKFLDRLDRTNQLAKTVLYNVNPRDNETFASMIGNFQDGSAPGKLQFGSAWWFMDQLDGMERQINALSNMGLLSRFVGMLTDSRSFLSYSRHDYFRRLLCNMLGHDVRRGLVPDDLELLGNLVRDVCFRNARSYFELPLPTAFVEAESAAA